MTCFDSSVYRPTSYCSDAAARATDSCLWSVHYEAEKQDVVRYFLKELELVDYVKFITEDPSTFIPQREGKFSSTWFVGVPNFSELFRLNSCLLACAMEFQGVNRLCV